MFDDLKKKMGNRKLALWGGFRSPYIGYFAHQSSINGSLCADLIITNSHKRDGTCFLQTMVVCPEKITDWGDYFVLVLTQSYREVKTQLEGYGLEEEKDFVRFSPSDELTLSANAIQKALEKAAINEYGATEHTAVVRNKKEYDEVCESYRWTRFYQGVIKALCANHRNQRIYYDGYCAVCKEQVNFVVDFDIYKLESLRESAICPKCGLASRTRFLFKHVTSSVDAESRVLVYEQITPLYKALKAFFPNLIGSEYLDGEYESGTIHNGCVIRGKVYDGLMHQDATNLSFSDNSLDVIVSADVMEHVQDYRKAFREVRRCLQDGGEVYFYNTGLP